MRLPSFLPLFDQRVVQILLAIGYTDLVTVPYGNESETLKFLAAQQADFAGVLAAHPNLGVSLSRRCGPKGEPTRVETKTLQQFPKKSFRPPVFDEERAA